MVGLYCRGIETMFYGYQTEHFFCVEFEKGDQNMTKFGI